MSDEFDFDFDGLDGMSDDDYETSGERDSTGERDAVSSIGKGIVEGALSLDSGMNALRAIKENALPRGYRVGLDAVEDLYGTASDAVDVFNKEIEPAKNAVKSLVRNNQDKVSKLPKWASKKLVDWAGDEDEYQYERIDPDQQAINQSTYNVFGNPEDEDGDRITKITDHALAKLTATNDLTEAGLLNIVASEAVKQSAFQTSIEADYMRKMLELGHLSYFTQRDLLKVISADAESSSLKLDAIVKNSALPDIVKSQMSEEYLYMAQQNMVGALQESVHEWMGGMTRNLRSNIMDNIRDFGGDLREGIMSAADAGEMMSEMQRDAEEMGVDTKAQLGKSLGSKLGSVIGKKAGKVARDKLSTKSYDERMEDLIKTVTYDRELSLKQERLIQEHIEALLNSNQEITLESIGQITEQEGLKDKDREKLTEILRPSALGGFTARRSLKDINEKLLKARDNPEMNRFDRYSRETENFMETWPEYMNEWAQGDRSVLDMLKEDDWDQETYRSKLRDSFLFADMEEFARGVAGSYNQKYNDLTNLRENADTLTQDNLIKHRTIVDIIPGYLSRILQAITGLSGEDKDLEVYDTNRGEWTTSTALDKRNLESILPKEEILQRQKASSQIVESIDKDGILSEEERLLLRNVLMRNRDNGKSLTENALYKADVNKEEETTYAGVLGKLENGEINLDRQTILENSRKYHSIRNASREAMRKINEIDVAGGRESLNRLGILDGNAVRAKKMNEYLEADLSRPFSEVQRASSEKSGFVKSAPIDIDFTPLNDKLDSLSEILSTSFNDRDSSITIDWDLGRNTLAPFFKEYKGLPVYLTDTDWFTKHQSDEPTEGPSAPVVDMAPVVSVLEEGFANVAVMLQQVHTASAEPETVAEESKGGLVSRLIGSGTRLGKLTARGLGKYYSFLGRTSWGAAKVAAGTANKVGSAAMAGLSDEEVEEKGAEKERSRILGFVQDGMANIKNVVGGAWGLQMDWMGKVASAPKAVLNAASEKLGGLRNAYVKGEKQPRIIAALLKKGYYKSSTTGEPIYSYDDIDGDVEDQNGEVVLTVDDLKQGIVDKLGVSLDVKSLGGLVADTAKRGMSMGVSAAKWAVGATSNYYKKLGDLGRGTLTGVSNLVRGKVNGSSDDTLRGTTETIPVLMEQLQVQRNIYAAITGEEFDPAGNAEFREMYADILDKVSDDGGMDKPTSKAIDVYRRDVRQVTKDESPEHGINLPAKTEEKEKEKEPSFLDKALAALPGVLGGAITGLGGILSTAITALGGASIAGSAADALGDIDVPDRGARRTPKGRGGLLRKTAGLGWSALKGAGRLTAGVGGGALRTAGGLALRGAGALLTGFSWPVLLGGAAITGLAYGGYKLYKHHQYNKALSSIETLRFLQYGIDTKDKDMIAYVRRIEEKFVDNISYKGDQPTFDAELGEFAEEFFEDAGLINNGEREDWAEWFTRRFGPVALTYLTILKKMGGKVDLDEIDDDLSKEDKQDLIRRVQFTREDASNGLNPYSCLYTPWPKHNISDNRDAIDSYVRSLLNEETAKGGRSVEATAAVATATAVKVAEVKSARSRSNARTKAEVVSPSNVDRIAPRMNRKVIKAAIGGATTVITASEVTAILSETTPSIKATAFKDVKERNTKATPLEWLRLMRYGVPRDRVSMAERIRELETAVMSYTNISDKEVRISKDAMFFFNMVGSRMGMDLRDAEQAKEWCEWFNLRFLPNYKAHNIAARKVMKSGNLWVVDSNLPFKDIGDYVALSDVMTEGNPAPIDVLASPVRNETVLSDIEVIRLWADGLIPTSGFNVSSGSTAKDINVVGNTAKGIQSTTSAAPTTNLHSRIKKTNRFNPSSNTVASTQSASSMGSGINIISMSKGKVKDVVKDKDGASVTIEDKGNYTSYSLADVDPSITKGVEVSKDQVLGASKEGQEAGVSTTNLHQRLSKQQSSNIISITGELERRRTENVLQNKARELAKEEAKMKERLNRITPPTSVSANVNFSNLITNDNRIHNEAQIERKRTADTLERIETILTKLSDVNVKETPTPPPANVKTTNTPEPKQKGDLRKAAGMDFSNTQSFKH